MDSQRVKSTLISLGLISAVSILFVVGVYLVHFHQANLSPSPADWGNFGSFFGGVLGPVFSFLAFVGLLVTILIQTKELETARASAIDQKREFEQAYETRLRELELASKQLEQVVVEKNLSEIERALRFVDGLLEFALTSKFDANGEKENLINIIEADNQTIIYQHERSILRLTSLLARLGSLLSEYERISKREYSGTISPYVQVWQDKYADVANQVTELANYNSGRDSTMELPEAEISLMKLLIPRAAV